MGVQTEDLCDQDRGRCLTCVSEDGGTREERPLRGKASGRKSGDTLRTDKACDVVVFRELRISNANVVCLRENSLDELPTREV